MRWFYFFVVLIAALADAGETERVPAEYRQAESAARQLLDVLGLNSQAVQVEYLRLGSNAVLGSHNEGKIIINLDRYPQSVRTVFHEAWHYVQESLEGRDAFYSGYGRYAYEGNPYETEARLVADRLGWLLESQSALFTPGRFAKMAPGLLRSVLPQVRALWAKDPEAGRTTLLRLSALEKTTARLADEAFAPVRGAMRDAAGQTAVFGAAYLVKSGLDSVMSRDPVLFGHRLKELLVPRNAVSMALSSLASGAANAWLQRLPFARGTVPLVAGMAVGDLVAGRFESKRFAIAASVTLVSATAVNFLADTFIYPALLAAGPPGWLAAGIYSVVKLVAVMYLSEGAMNVVKPLLMPKPVPCGMGCIGG